MPEIDHYSQNDARNNLAKQSFKYFSGKRSRQAISVSMSSYAPGLFITCTV